MQMVSLGRDPAFGVHRIYEANESDKNPTTRKSGDQPVLDLVVLVGANSSRGTRLISQAGL